MPGNIPAFSIATNPIPKDGSDYDMIVVGGGVLGSAFSATFGKQGKRVLMIGKIRFPLTSVAVNASLYFDSNTDTLDLLRVNLHRARSQRARSHCWRAAPAQRL